MNEYYIDFSLGKEEFQKTLSVIRDDVASFGGVSWSVIELQEEGIVLKTGVESELERVHRSAVELFQASHNKERVIQSETCFALLSVSWGLSV